MRLYTDYSQRSIAQPSFEEECRRQSQLVAQADMADADMLRFLGEALADVDGWME